MHTPLVSIIIPLYNGEKYIVAAIQSALSQTWPNTEIIIIDDGSTDGSLSIAREFENEQIKVFSQVNKGASVARNYGLAQSKGMYIQFLDADDLLSPNKIAAQIKALQGYPDHIGLCTTVHFMDGTDHLSIPPVHEWVSHGSDNPGDFLTKLYGGTLIGPQYGGMVQPNAWLTPRALIEKAGPWNENLTTDDDGEFFCRVILASQGVKYAYDAVNYYRKFNDSLNLSAQKSYAACNSTLHSTTLKAQHLYHVINTPSVKTVLSRLFWENAFSFYLCYPNLLKKAEDLARYYDPNYKPEFFKTGLKKYLTNLWGWKITARLSKLK